MATHFMRYTQAPVAGARRCGECVACCVHLHIDAPGLRKPAGAVCPHCTGSACGIYAQRPQPCRDWLCTWMRAPEIPDDYRPDRLGVMFSYQADPQSANLFERRYFVGRYLRDPATVDMDKVSLVLDYLSRASVRVPIWLSRDGEMRLVHPRKPLADEVAGAADASEDALAWRRALTS